MGPGASGLQLFQDSLYWRLPRYVRQAFALLMQALIALVDRVDGVQARRHERAGVRARGAAGMRFAPIQALRARRVPSGRWPGPSSSGPSPMRITQRRRSPRSEPTTATSTTSCSPSSRRVDGPGLMVEPVPYVFDRLRRRYESMPGVTLENVAVGPTEGRAPVLPPGRGRRPRAGGAAGVVRRHRIVLHARRCWRTARTSPTSRAGWSRPRCRPCPLDTLCARNGIRHLDLILVDTEGHDWEIIRSLDARGLEPAPADLRALPPVGRMTAGRAAQHLARSRLRDDRGALRHLLPGHVAWTTT